MVPTAFRHGYININIGMLCHFLATAATCAAFDLSNCESFQNLISLLTPCSAFTAQCMAPACVINSPRTWRFCSSNHTKHNGDVLLTETVFASSTSDPIQNTRPLYCHHQNGTRARIRVSPSCAGTASPDLGGGGNKTRSNDSAGKYALDVSAVFKRTWFAAAKLKTRWCASTSARVRPSSIVHRSLRGRSSTQATLVIWWQSGLHLSPVCAARSTSHRVRSSTCPPLTSVRSSSPRQGLPATNCCHSFHSSFLLKSDPSRTSLLALALALAVALSLSLSQ